MKIIVPTECHTIVIVRRDEESQNATCKLLVASTYNAVYELLDQYVIHWWSHEVHDGEDMPTTRDARIAQYFQECEVEEFQYLGDVASSADYKVVDRGFRYFF